MDSRERCFLYTLSPALIEPQATVTKMNNVQMEVLYNTVYDVNVMANSADCGSTSTVIILSYGEHNNIFDY